MPTPKKPLTIGLSFLVAIGLVLGSSFSASAIFSLPDELTPQQSTRTPRDVERFGNIEVTDVRSPVDNTVLFEIASRTYDRAGDSDSQEGQPVEARAEEISEKLRRAVTRPMDPDTLIVAVSQENNVPVIVATDADYTLPLVLASVTKIDADYHGRPVDELANQWRDTLDAALQRGLIELSAEIYIDNLERSSKRFFGLVGFTVGLVALKYLISRRQAVLLQRKRSLETQSVNASTDPQSPSSPRGKTQVEALIQLRTQFLHGLNQVLSLDRKLGFWSFVQWLLFWVALLTWCIGISQILRRLPYFATLSSGALEKPIELLAVWFFTGLAVRLSRRLIDRFKRNWQEHDFIDFIDLGDAQRRSLRTATIAGAAKGMITVLITIFSILTALQILGVPGTSVLAITSLLGLAISFGSQSLVKDLVNGFLILAEDQYAIGDVVDIGGTAGLVENLNLRITQLRSGAGELITLPNSSITQVKNLTRTWSRVNFSIDVAYQTDPEKALAVLKTVAQELYDDPNWHDTMLEPPDVLGIDSVSHSGMTLTIWIKTVPLEQWGVGRELRLRVRQALATNGIEIGIPQQAYLTESAEHQGNGHEEVAADYRDEDLASASSS